MNETKYFNDALELQVEAKKIGLDWLTTDGIILKLQEETFEVSEEIKKNNKTSIKEAGGAVFFIERLSLSSFAGSALIIFGIIFKIFRAS